MPTARQLHDQSRLGARLRAARRARGLSLKDVQVAADGTIDSNMLGAYERGDHAITAVRLARLARLYGVSLEDLFSADDEHDLAVVGRSGSERAIRFDMSNLANARRREAKAVARLAETIRERRHRRNAAYIELRHDDLLTIASSFGLDVGSLVEVLQRTGALRRGSGRPPA